VKLVRCVVLALAALQVQNLVRNHPLAKSIGDVSWNLFIRWLDYYRQVFNKVVIAVPPQYTSQDCSNCGHPVKKTLLSKREPPRKGERLGR